MPGAVLAITRIFFLTQPVTDKLVLKLTRMLSIFPGITGSEGPTTCNQLHPPSASVIITGESPELVNTKLKCKVSPIGTLPSSKSLDCQLI